MVREKYTKSGPLFEADFIHIFSDGRRIPTRTPKTKPSTEEQAKYNRRQAEKKIIRLVNANFDNTDIIMHPTYSPENAPQSEIEARRDMVNYLRRQKTFRKSEAMRLRKYLETNSDDIRAKKNLQKLEQEFKYIYVIEKIEYKTGKKAGLTNWHFHLFMTGGGDGDRDRAEESWKSGIRVNADRFRPDKWGPEAAAKYISKDPQGSKRFVCSRNLTKPETPKPKDGKMSARHVEKLAKERNDDPAYWENRYKGYRFVKCYARQNPFNGYWYISVVMYRTDGTVPRWEVDDWITNTL